MKTIRISIDQDLADVDVLISDMIRVQFLVGKEVVDAPGEDHEIWDLVNEKVEDYDSKYITVRVYKRLELIMDKVQEYKIEYTPSLTAIKL